MQPISIELLPQSWSAVDLSKKHKSWQDAQLPSLPTHAVAIKREVPINDDHLVTYDFPGSENTVVIMLHGGSIRASYTEDIPLAAWIYAALAGQVRVFTCNHRGSQSKEIMQRYSLLSRIEDGVTMVEYVRKNNPDVKIILFGNSAGGHVAARLAEHMVKEKIPPVLVYLDRPAAYATEAETALWGEPFSTAIRTIQPDASPAFGSIFRVAQAKIPLVVAHYVDDPVVVTHSGEQIPVKYIEAYKRGLAIGDEALLSHLRYTGGHHQIDFRSLKELGNILAI